MMTVYQKDLFTEKWMPVRPPREVSNLQIPLVKMLKNKLRPDVLMRHYTSGGYDARSGAKLKLMGRVAGSSDLEFLWREGDTLRILFIELNPPGRKLSPAQIAFKERVRHLGPYCVATTIDDALDTLMALGLLSSDAYRSLH
jgi:hypothetical protein